LLENPKFTTESTQTPLRELTIKKKTKFSTENSPKYAIFRPQNQKFAPSQTPLRRGGGVPGGEGLPPSALRPPNFELALTPLRVP